MPSFTLLTLISFSVTVFAFPVNPVFGRTVSARRTFYRRDSSFLLTNGQLAQNLNAKFATLKPTDSCNDSDGVVCINGSTASCVDGQYVLQPCAADLQCFALPLVKSAGTSVSCDTQADVEARIAQTGATGGLTGSGSNNSTASAAPSATGADSSSPSDSTTSAASASTATSTDDGDDCSGDDDGDEEGNTDDDDGDDSTDCSGDDDSSTTIAPTASSTGVDNEAANPFSFTNPSSSSSIFATPTDVSVIAQSEVPATFSNTQASSTFFASVTDVPRTTDSYGFPLPSAVPSNFASESGLLATDSITGSAPSETATGSGSLVIVTVTVTATPPAGTTDCGDDSGVTSIGTDNSGPAPASNTISAAGSAISSQSFLPTGTAPIASVASETDAPCTDDDVSSTDVASATIPLSSFFATASAPAAISTGTAIATDSFSPDSNAVPSFSASETDSTDLFPTPTASIDSSAVTSATIATDVDTTTEDLAFPTSVFSSVDATTSSDSSATPTFASAILTSTPIAAPSSAAVTSSSYDYDYGGYRRSRFFRNLQ